MLIVLQAPPGTTNRGRKKTISLDPPHVSVHPSSERPPHPKRQKVVSSLLKKKSFQEQLASSGLFSSTTSIRLGSYAHGVVS